MRFVALAALIARATCHEELRNSTRPSDIDALLALYDANGRQDTLIGWGEGDPCVGDAPLDQGNAQGFGPWKGVACVPCPEPERNYYCVSQIWQHQKNLNGTIPETFRGLSELQWLLLSGNNLTGPFPQNNWATFPKLRKLDVSYNNIDGTLPLDRLSSIPALRTLLANDNHFDDLCYNGGGFKNLRDLVINYNRNLSAAFPEGVDRIPNLRTFEIHDTAIVGGPIPDGPGSWPSIQNLIVTGTGGLCGPLPAVCQRPGVFCDVTENFGPCPGEVVFGTPLSSFHNATVYVYQQAMLKLGYKVKVISKYEHPILYAMFTGFGGLEAGCTHAGCVDKCEENGLGSTSPCIDFVVDSDIPTNHLPWLEPYQATYDVMGTAFETQYISLFAPGYSGIKNISQVATSIPSKRILGFRSAPGDDCDALYCPRCGGEPFLTGPPLGPAGFEWRGYYCEAFAGVIRKLLKKRENFVIESWIPNVWGAVFPELVPIDMEAYTPEIKPNQGKALMSTSSRWKFSDKAFNVLGAVFIGSEDVALMDAWSHGFRLKGEGPLCDYMSWNNACSLEAALRWIEKNQDHVNKYGTITQGNWKTFFW